MTSQPRPAARGSRKTKAALKLEQRSDQLKAEGVLTPEDEAANRAQAEARNCPRCGKRVHPANWQKHMQKYHPDNPAALHEADSHLPLIAIRKDGGTQSRAALYLQVVHDYAEALSDGKRFPPLVVFYDGADYWLADGFHRYQAAKSIGQYAFEVNVKQGTQRDAILYSVSANSEHGLQRTNEDKRRAVERLLTDEEWVKWSDREIARRCHVSQPYVSRLRAEIVPSVTDNVISETRTYTTKHGTTATMQTGNIGKRDEPVTYGKKEDDFQDDVPAVEADSEETSEAAPFMPGQSVFTPSGFVGPIVSITGRFANVQTINGVRTYNIAKLKPFVADAPAQPIDRVDAQTGEVTQVETLSAPTKPDFNYKRDSKVSVAANQYVPQGMDAFQTPAYALDPLIPYLTGFRHPALTGSIWEPAAGEGHLVEGLYDAGWEQDQVIATDILTGQNFFDYQPNPPSWQIIVTNPPFSLKFEWMQHCYELGKPFALLLPVEAIGAKTAQDLMKTYGFEIMLLDSRVDFKTPNKKWDGAGAQFSVLWFCWHLLPEQVTFGSIAEGKRAFQP